MVNIPDLLLGPLPAPYVALPGYHGSPPRSLLATPVRFTDSVIGVLNAESTTVDAFKPVHQRILASIATQIALALRRTQMFGSGALSAELDRLMFAADDSHSVIQIALERVLDELQRLEHVQHSSAEILFLRDGNELEVVHGTNSSDIGLVISIDKSIVGRAIRERRTVVVSSLAGTSVHSLLGNHIQSEIAIPILFGDDDMPIGALNVESDDPDAFTGFSRVLLEGFAEKVKTLLAVTKLRSDVTEVLEMRSANDLLVAVGDQATNMIHRLNSMVGAMRARIVELQEIQQEGSLADDFLTESLEGLRKLAESTLQMPREVTRLLAAEDAKVDINSCVQDALSQLEIPDQIHLEVDLGVGIPDLSLYSFDVVVLNLIQNALDAMPEGGVLGVATSVLQHVTSGSAYFQLIITDTGVGIPDDIQSRIFELNFTTKSAKGKGMGLGLWWVRNFVRRARGDITLHSTGGLGTKVIVKIPFEYPNADTSVDGGWGVGTGDTKAIADLADEGTERGNERTGDASVTADSHVLIVDDEVAWCEIFRRAIIAQGTVKTIEVARDLASAERLIEATNFAVAFVDIGLDSDDDRDMGGLRVIQKIRATAQETSIIVVTGRSAADLVSVTHDVIKKYNALDVVAKSNVMPSDISKLLDSGLAAYNSFTRGQR